MRRLLARHADVVRVAQILPFPAIQEQALSEPSNPQPKHRGKVRLAFVRAPGAHILVHLLRTILPTGLLDERSYLHETAFTQVVRERRQGVELVLLERTLDLADGVGCMLSITLREQEHFLLSDGVAHLNR